MFYLLHLNALSHIHSHLPSSHQSTHDPVQYTTLSIYTYYRGQYCELFHWWPFKCEHLSQTNETKNTIFISVTPELQDFLPCASRQTKQCFCNDSNSSSRITIESCESAMKKTRSESEKNTVSLFIHTSRINISEKLDFLFQTLRSSKNILKENKTIQLRNPRNFLTLKIFHSSRS